MLTVFLSRMSVVFWPDGEFILFGLVVHHFWYGIFILFLLCLVPQINKGLKNIFLAMALGFIADELIFIICGAGGDVEYWNWYSWSGAVFLVLIFYLIGQYIEDTANKKNRTKIVN